MNTSLKNEETGMHPFEVWEIRNSASILDKICSWAGLRKGSIPCFWWEMGLLGLWPHHFNVFLPLLPHHLGVTLSLLNSMQGPSPVKVLNPHIETFFKMSLRLRPCIFRGAMNPKTLLSREGRGCIEQSSTGMLQAPGPMSEIF